MKKLNIGIIGCGRISGHHCKSIIENQNLELTAVCDLNEDLCKNYAEEFNTSYYTNYREMLVSKPEIDIITIATPSGMHFEHGMEILDKFKKNIIVEKPTFMVPSQIKSIYEVAIRNNLNVFPVFQNRYNTAVQRVKKAIVNNEIGEKRIVNVRVRWCRPQRYYDMSKWRGTYSHDGGALSNQGIHHIDLLRYLGGEIDSVNCTMRTLGADIEVEDTAIASIKYRDGSVGTLEVTTAARPDDFEASLSIVGSKGLVQLGGVAVNMLEIFSPEPNECKIHSDSFHDLPDRGRVYGRGHMEMYRDIVSFYRDNKEFPVNMNDCYNTIKLLHAFYLSDENSSWVNLNDDTVSQRLGRENDEISNLFRTKF